MEKKATTICSMRRGNNRFLFSLFFFHRAPEHGRYAHEIITEID
jgi:hypothetical protein